jgi:hypothetical protein
MWQKIKTFFLKSQLAPEVSFEQTIQPIFEEQNEPFIKKMKREITCQKDSKCREKYSPDK